MLRKAALLPVLAVAIGIGACDSSTSPRTGQLTVLLTDAPGDYLESATVEIGRIEVIGVDGTRTTVTEDGGTFNLLDLQDGVTAHLGTVQVDPGLYRELRMIVKHASVTLLEGYEFQSGGRTMDIHVPSGAASGIKIGLAYADGEQGAGVEIRPGETILVVDFDVGGNFVMQGSPERPSGIKGFNFTPRLRAVVRDVAGSISGTVAPLGLLTDTLTATATRQGAPTEEAPATASVAEDGTFMIRFLAPGTYDVTLTRLADGETANSVEVSVDESEAETGVELTITP
ncbi:MAG TPA: DUF4382 domain-containing protein [Longimicrobiales bacterium]|nr:DUF4382 domain-containing protein [Longimicrobiales bacterium]